ncbi:MAG TPA: hypothetical protein VFO63_03110 [Blastocatellia bacterium]|nr:hypothetical protein [Blastocatellia bacterium]
MRRLSLVMAETMLLLVVGLTAAYLRLAHNLSYELSERQGWMKLILTTFVIQLSFYLFDLYSLPATRDYRRVVINLAKALGAATVLLAILFFALPVLELGRGVFLVNLGLTFVAVAAWRKLVAWSTGHPQLGVRERVLILGSGKQADDTRSNSCEAR